MQNFQPRVGSEYLLNGDTKVQVESIFPETAQYLVKDVVTQQRVVVAASQLSPIIIVIDDDDDEPVNQQPERGGEYRERDEEEYMTEVDESLVMTALGKIIRYLSLEEEYLHKFEKRLELKSIRRQLSHLTVAHYEALLKEDIDSQRQNFSKDTLFMAQRAVERRLWTIQGQEKANVLMRLWNSSVLTTDPEQDAANMLLLLSSSGKGTCPTKGLGAIFGPGFEHSEMGLVNRLARILEARRYRPNMKRLVRAMLNIRDALALFFGMRPDKDPHQVVQEPFSMYDPIWREAIHIWFVRADNGVNSDILDEFFNDINDSYLARTLPVVRPKIILPLPIVPPQQEELMLLPPLRPAYTLRCRLGGARDSIIAGCSIPNYEPQNSCLALVSEGQLGKEKQILLTGRVVERLGLPRDAVRTVYPNMISGDFYRNGRYVTDDHEPGVLLGRKLKKNTEEPTEAEWGILKGPASDVYGDDEKQRGAKSGIYRSRGVEVSEKYYKNNTGGGREISGHVGFISDGRGDYSGKMPHRLILNTRNLFLIEMIEKGVGEDRYFQPGHQVGLLPLRNPNNKGDVVSADHVDIETGRELYEDIKDKNGKITNTLYMIRLVSMGDPRFGVTVIYDRNNLVLAIYVYPLALLRAEEESAEKRSRLGAFICANCSTPNSKALFCGHCDQVTYCNQQCAQQHWDVHSSLAEKALTNKP